MALLRATLTGIGIELVMGRRVGYRAIRRVIEATSRRDNGADSMLCMPARAAERKMDSRKEASRSHGARVAHILPALHEGGLQEFERM